ncbi:unnamed protein product [Prunus armeniaca]
MVFGKNCKSAFGEIQKHLEWFWKKHLRVHYVGTLLHGTKFESTRDTDEPLNLNSLLYRVALVDGTVVAETPEEGIELYVKKDALPKEIKTMKKGEKVRLIIQPQYAFGVEGRDSNKGFHFVLPSFVLNIDLEVVSFKPVIDVTGDAKVIKKVMKEGEGAWVANESASVTVEFWETVTCRTSSTENG